MKATKRRMKQGCEYSNNVQEISELYITGCDNPGLFKKDVLYDYLIDNPGSIQVDIYPYPNLIPVKSVYGEKYVRSSPNNSTSDNLLSLPKV